MSFTYPVRNLTDVQARNLIGQRVTVRAYDTPEQPESEPSITLSGKIAMLAVTSKSDVVIVFEGATAPPSPLGPNEPVTVTVDFHLSD